MHYLKRLIAVLLAMSFILATGAVGFVFAADEDVMYVGEDKSKVDSDFDGIPDDMDKKPADNGFSGKIKSGYDHTTYSYTMDFRDFFKDNKEYHPTLASASVIGATLCNYGAEYEYAFFTFDEAQILQLTGGEKTKVHGLEMLEIMGFEDPVDYTLAEYQDDDMDEMLVGHKTMTYGGITKELVAVWVRGTRPTSVEEWSSNFNLGDITRFFDDYDAAEGNPERGTNADWTRRTNHRGFDICATRFLRYLNEKYLPTYVMPKVERLGIEAPTFWLCGHSRGSGISNIMGSYLVDDGLEVFAFTYASPGTTVNPEASAERYDCIFNLVNVNDFIPYLPMPEWGFTRYGRTALVASADYEEEVTEAIGESYSGKYLEEDEAADLVSKFLPIIGESADRDNPGKYLGWKEVYVYHCGHNHDGETNSPDVQETTIYKNPLDVTGLATEAEYEGYADHLKKYSYFTDGGICEMPIFVFQVLAEMLAALASGQYIEGVGDFLLSNRLAEKFDFMKTSLIPYAMKLTAPHRMDVYSVMQTGINNDGDPGARFQTLAPYTDSGEAGGRPSHTHTYELVPYEGQEPTYESEGFGYQICHCSEQNEDWYDDIIKDVTIPKLVKSATVEKEPDPDPAPGTVPEQTNTTGTETESIAKTGDSENLAFIAGFTVFCGLGLAVLKKASKKERA